MTSINLLLVIIFVSTCVHAQYEWENVYNPRTARTERVYNPGNPTQATYERQQQERQAEELMRQSNANIKAINDEYNRRRDEANERMKRNQEFWDDMARDMQFKMIEMNSRTNYGNSIIKAGKASTTYQPNPNFDFIKALAKRAKNSQQLDLIEQYADESRKRFYSELAARGLAKDDLADGVVLVFVMSYEVYTNQKPSNAIAQDMRQKIKSSLLKNPIFQSYSSDERQQDYELYATLTGYTRLLSEKGMAGDKAALIEAQTYAKGLMEKFWGNSVNTIQLTSTGFVHKGAKIIADGKATTLFKYNSNLPTAEMHISKQSQYRDEFIRDNKQRLQLFYQVMGQKGGQRGDLAWCGTMIAYANFVVIAKGQDWNSAQLNSAYNFVKNAVLKLPDIQAASDDDKQIACENMAMDTVANYQNFAKGGDNIYGTGPIAQSYLDSLFRALGEDIKNYQWSSSGIVRIK